MGAANTRAEVCVQAQRLGIGGVIAEPFAVAFGGDDVVVIQGTREQLLALLDGTAAALRAAAAAELPPLAVCAGCAEPIAWDPAQQRYVDLRAAGSSCGDEDDHAPGFEETADVEAEHVNALHIRAPEPRTCPWCVVDVAAAGDPTVTYCATPSETGDPTRVPPHLRRLVPELADTGSGGGCPAREGLYPCTWRDPVHVERDVPHVTGTGTSVHAVWSVVDVRGRITVEPTTDQLPGEST